MDQGEQGAAAPPPASGVARALPGADGPAGEPAWPTGESPLAVGSGSSMRQLAFLAEAGALLASSLDYEATLDRLAHLALPWLGDACALDLVRPDGGIRQIVAALDPLLAERMLAVRREYPLDRQGRHPVARVLRGERSYLCQEVGPGYADEVGRDARHRALIADLGVRSIVCVALAARGSVLGTISFFSATGGAFGPWHVALTEALGRQAALAIDNARLYQEARDALQALKESQARVVQAAKLAAIGTLAAGVAHELNQPLMVIRGQAQLLLADGDGDPTRRRRAERIERQTGKMAAIIDHLRVFGDSSPDGAGEPVDLNVVAREALLLVGAQLRERGLVVGLDLDRRAPIVLAETARVKEVVLNLLINARDALGRAGGQIMVRTRAEAGRGLLTIADTGPGISEAIAGRLFEPFFTTKEVGQGTGLGLPISRDIARRWGGDLTLTNRTDGPGAVATLTLPLHPAP